MEVEVRVEVCERKFGACFTGKIDFALLPDRGDIFMFEGDSEEGEVMAVRWEIGNGARPLVYLRVYERSDKRRWDDAILLPKGFALIEEFTA